METKDLLKKMNERPVAYQPIYAKITGSVTAGILLSQILYWWSAMEEEEFYKTDESWCKELSFGLKELKGAKEKIKKTGIVEIERKGNPAKTHYLVNEEMLINLITSCAKRDELVVPKGHNKLCQKVTTILYTENTTDTKTENSNSKELQSQELVIRPKKEKSTIPDKTMKDTIDKWKAINPLYKDWYGNKTQRKSVERLLTDKDIDESQIKWVIDNLEKIASVKFMPNISTPHLLLKNWSALVSQIKKQSLEKKGGINVISAIN